jgi:hypothetical protein
VRVRVRLLDKVPVPATCSRGRCQELRAPRSVYCEEHRIQQAGYTARRKESRRAKEAAEAAEAEAAKKAAKNKKKKEAERARERVAEKRNNKVVTADVVHSKPQPQVSSPTETATITREPSTPSPLAPLTFTDTPTPTQRRGTAIMAENLWSGHEKMLRALGDRLGQARRDIGVLMSDNATLLMSRCEMADQLDRMSDRLDRMAALTAGFREQDSRRARAPTYPTERDRYRSRSRSYSPQFREREHRYRR